MEKSDFYIHCICFRSDIVSSVREFWTWFGISTGRFNFYDYHFPDNMSFLSVAMNAIFCVLYGLNIHFGFFAVHPSDENFLISWVAISSNLIFLNGIFSILIPRVFKGKSYFLGVFCSGQRYRDRK